MGTESSVDIELYKVGKNLTQILNVLKIPKRTLCIEIANHLKKPLVPMTGPGADIQCLLQLPG